MGGTFNSVLLDVPLVVVEAAAVAVGLAAAFD